MNFFALNVVLVAASLLLCCQATQTPDVVVLEGRSYANCQGRYEKSTRIFNGKPVWIRTEPDDSRFAFYNADKRFAITGSQWLEVILKQQKKKHGSFVKASNNADDFLLTEWKDMQMTDPDFAELRGHSSGNCQGVYEKSMRIFNGKPIWIRTEPDDSRFAFYNADKHFAITRSDWLEAVLKKQNAWWGHYVRANNNADDFILTKWNDMFIIPEVVVLKGRSKHNCQGRYEKIGRIFNGQPVWRRTEPDDRRFAFYNTDKRYAITGSQWLEAILKKQNKWHSYFVQATNMASDFIRTEWKDITATYGDLP